MVSDFGATHPYPFQMLVPPPPPGSHRPHKDIHDTGIILLLANGGIKCPLKNYLVRCLVRTNNKLNNYDRKIKPYTIFHSCIFSLEYFETPPPRLSICF